MSEIVKFIHPELISWNLCCPSVLKTKEAFRLLIRGVLRFTRNRKDAKFTAYFNVMLPQLFPYFKTIVERDRPAYRVSWENNTVFVKRKSRFP
uniref:Transposase n=1 Tax=Panagrellus redivivus TaxID=6233 RepID=A0A7E4ZR03_PANRE